MQSPEKMLSEHAEMKLIWRRKCAGIEGVDCAAKAF